MFAVSIFWTSGPGKLGWTFIGGIERGERNVALVNIEKIAKTLGLSISELFRGT